MEPTLPALPATPEIEFLVTRRKDLEMQLKKTAEMWHSINGAIQECNNSLSALSKMQIEQIAKNAKNEVPECIPNNEDAA